MEFRQIKLWILGLSATRRLNDKYLILNEDIVTLYVRAIGPETMQEAVSCTEGLEAEGDGSDKRHGRLISAYQSYWQRK